MAPEQFEFNAEIRIQKGRSATRRLRLEEDRVPATLYGAGKEPQSIMLLHKDILRAIRNEAIFSSILTLNIDGKKQQAVFKGMQRHHTKPRVMHIDFQRIKASEKLTMTIPLNFIGEEVCPGVIAGGIVSRLLTSIDIRCLPAHLPTHIDVDISSLELDESLHLSHLKLPEGVELTAANLDEEHDAPIVSVHIPRVSQADIEAEAAEASLAAEASAEAAAEEQAVAPSEEATPEESSTQTDEQE